MLHVLRCPEFFQNPYPAYQQLRKTGLPLWLPFNEARTHTQGTWLFFQHDDVVDLINNTQSVSHGLTNVRLPGQGHLYDLNMLFRDGDDHGRLRGVVSQFFSHKTIQQWSDDILCMADEQLDRLGNSKGNFDVVADYAALLPLKVMLQMLGLPEDDLTRIRNWTLDLHDLTDSLLDQRVAGRPQAMADLLTYVDQQYQADRTDQANTTIIATLQQAQRAGELSRHEALAMLVLLLVAGNATTTALISSTLWLLLANPAQMELIHATPTLIDQALEETLRYESPAQRTIFRITTQPIDLSRFHIESGQQISLVLGSAHRDPAAFDRPDVFDITRSGKSNLAFGRGVHTCLGKHLALLEARLILGALLQRFPNIQLATDKVSWRQNSMFRELAALPVKAG
jgi:cytochrome P450